MKSWPGQKDSMEVVSVQDNGGGIPAEIVARIFEPYFTSKPLGTGIGLYMSKMIIEKSMKGRIELLNCEGGCIFTVYIPLGELLA